MCSPFQRSIAIYSAILANEMAVFYSDDDLTKFCDRHKISMNDISKRTIDMFDIGGNVFAAIIYVGGDNEKNKN